MDNKLLPLARSISGAKGWDNVTRQIMLAGKTLSALDSTNATAHNEVAGCQSLVYLWASKASHKTACFQGWSDAKIIRGVLAVLLEKANALTYEQVLTFDFALYLDQIGLSRHLSQSRADGITQVISRLKTLAFTLQ